MLHPYGSMLLIVWAVAVGEKEKEGRRWQRWRKGEKGQPNKMRRATICGYFIVPSCQSIMTLSVKSVIRCHALWWASELIGGFGSFHVLRFLRRRKKRRRKKRKRTRAKRRRRRHWAAELPGLFGQRARQNELHILRKHRKPATVQCEVAKMAIP